MNFNVFMLIAGLAVFVLLDSSEGIPTETPITTTQKPSLDLEAVDKAWGMLISYDRAYKKRELDSFLYERINNLSSEGLDIIFDRINALTSEEIMRTTFLEFLERQKKVKEIGSKTDTEINTMIVLLKSKIPKYPFRLVDKIWNDLKTFNEREEDLGLFSTSHLMGVLPAEHIDIIIDRINALTPAEIKGNFFLSLLKAMKEHGLTGNKTEAEIDAMIDRLKSKLPWSTWLYNLITFNFVVSNSK